MKTKLLLVEDSKAISDPLSFLLEREGYRTKVVGDGREAVGAFHSFSPEVILLDLMLPGLSGTEICRQIREESSVPIIMLTAKDSEVDIVLGLELGADDYVTKPYSTQELLARIRSVLRRHQAEPLETDTRLTVRNIQIDLESHTVEVDNEPVYMPLKEFELLSFLAMNAGRVLTRGQLLDRVWGSDYFGDTKTLDVHVKRIRSKIEATPEHPTSLVTVRGLGYKLNA